MNLILTFSDSITGREKATKHEAANSIPTGGFVAIFGTPEQWNHFFK